MFFGLNILPSYYYWSPDQLPIICPYMVVFLSIYGGVSGQMKYTALRMISVICNIHDFFFFLVFTGGS